MSDTLEHHPVPLRKLIAATDVVSRTGPDDISVDGIAYDSRTVTPGCLFVSVPSISDHDFPARKRYVQQAIDRGAVAIMSDEVLDQDGVTMLRVGNPRAALADVAAEFFDHPSRELTICAVTGTDGKTTTTYLLEQILSAAGFVTGLVGTVETKIGSQRVVNLDRMTTPESLDVQRLLRRMVDAGVTHVAMEASSHALALDRLRGCVIAVAGVTNITADHVEFHGSLEAYVAAKASLFSDLAKGRPAVLNRDDSSYERLAPLVSGPMWTYGMTDQARVYVSDVASSQLGWTATLHADGHRFACAIPLPGTFNVYNALAAAALALALHIPLATVAGAISSSSPPPGRMQVIGNRAGLTVMVDYAHTVNGFESVLSSLRAHTPEPSRLFAVFGATGDRDRAKRPILARIARKYTDYFVVTNEDPYGEDAMAIISEVVSGVPAEERGRAFDAELDRGKAIEQALKRAEPGDVVVVLGKGHEQSMVVGGVKHRWNDAEAVRHALKDRA